MRVQWAADAADVRFHWNHPSPLSASVRIQLDPPQCGRPLWMTPYGSYTHHHTLLNSRPGCDPGITGEYVTRSICQSALRLISRTNSENKVCSALWLPCLRVSLQDHDSQSSSSCLVLLTWLHWHISNAWLSVITTATDVNCFTKISHWTSTSAATSWL